MGLLTGLGKRLRAALRPSAADGEMSEELIFHLQMETEKNIRAGTLTSPPPSRIFSTSVPATGPWPTSQPQKLVAVAVTHSFFPVLGAS